MIYYTQVDSVIKKIIFYNQHTKFGIVQVNNTVNDNNFTDSFITLSGNMEGIYEKAHVTFSGELFNHDRYGIQIKLDSFIVLNNLSSKESIINFLSKSSIKGIDIQNAIKIYNKYGENSVNIVLHDADKLYEIKGIGDKTVNKIKNSADSYKRMQTLIEYCNSIQIPFSLIYRIDKELGEDAYKIIKENPYTALDFSENLTFKQMDMIAIKQGISLISADRIQACLLYSLNKCVRMTSSTGTGYASPKLKEIFFKELGEDNLNYYYAGVNLLNKKGKIVLEDNIIYNKEYYDIEKRISIIIKEIVKKEPQKKIFKKSIIEEEIQNFPYELNEQQIFAIKKCLINNICVLTGLPGSGKSTVTKALANIYARSNFKVILLTPTGKATRRLEECTERKAMTIHKFLILYKKGLAELTDKSIFLVDESSMIDIKLFNDLIEIVHKNNAKLVLIGDPNQLPSVQSGNVFEDIIKSKIVSICRLSDIMRQSKDSNIIKYCNSINKGISIDLCDTKDFIYKVIKSEDLFRKILCELYIKEVEKNGLNNVQVITPYKEGDLGLLKINKLLDDLCNDNDENQTFGYKKGSKIVNLVNNYKKDVFNGETGTITDIDKDYLYANINGKSIEYSIEEINDIQLANVLTVHRVQGSEYPVVFIILDDSRSNFLLIRKLLYTAVSRGKKKVYILSKPNCVDTCIHNDYCEKRETKLRGFLEESEEIPC